MSLILPSVEYILKTNKPFSKLSKFITYAGFYLLKLYDRSYKISDFHNNESELSESVGVYLISVKLLFDYKSDTSIHCYVIGDGVKASTGVVFAKNTSWNVHSVDPRMRQIDHNISNLTIHKCIDDEFIIPDGASITLIISTHGHFNHDKFYSRINGKKILVTMPCCHPEEQSLTYDKYVSYKDKLIFGEHNDIHIYTNIDFKK